ncbi:MAG: ATP-dependent DNA ligase [Clostridiaceae bacterium]|nr:ATP-dependent DNA ligase [Clostridiaceae bacterium]
MDWIVPMEPILTTVIPEGDNFIHQVKWDGIRGLCYVEKGQVHVFTKKGRERTGFYPKLNELPLLLKCNDAILDGEIIILNDEMRPSFQLSLIRERVTSLSKVDYYAKQYPVQYIVFDLLSIDGKKITHMPLAERSTLLKENLDTSATITITDDFKYGSQLFDLMKEKGWEGIVSKDASSPYLPGKKHQHWYKRKISRRILAVVAGLTLKEGRPNSLVLAIQKREGLVFIGKASIGLNQDNIRLLEKSIPELTIHESPLKTPKNADYIASDKTLKELKDVVWLYPVLTVWISFLERTDDGGLRHPKITGFTSLSPKAADGTEFID